MRGLIPEGQFEHLQSILVIVHNQYLQSFEWSAFSLRGFTAVGCRVNVRLRRACGQRQIDGKRSSLAFALAGHRNFAPMKLYKVLRDRKAKPEAAMLPAAGTVSLLEA